MSRSLRDVVFVDGARSPFGKAGGSLKGVRADDLIVKVMRGLLKRNASLPLDRIDEVAIAATTQAGDQGMTLGRSAALLAGLPQGTPGYSIERMCAGGMTAATTVAGGIAAGALDVAIAGGVEHMTRHPIGEGFDPNPRFFSEGVFTADALNMGVTAENIHDLLPHLTKERSDRYAVASQRKTSEAYRNGWIQPDLIPIAVLSEARWQLLSVDEPMRPGTTVEGLAGLRTPFRPHGMVTAGNSSPLTDGATACILAAQDAADELGLTQRMRMVGYAFAGVDPDVMGLGPVPSTERALRWAGMSIDDIDLFELNEAFAVQVLSFLDHFGIDDDDPRVNPMGGALAVGHPLASSGVRLMTNLARDFERNPEARYGVTAMCVGLGQGGTVIWESIHA